MLCQFTSRASVDYRLQGFETPHVVSYQSWLAAAQGVLTRRFPGEGGTSFTVPSSEKSAVGAGAQRLKSAGRALVKFIRCRG